MSAIFLFNGGRYKRGDDDGRLRLPLEPFEYDAVMYDPHRPDDTDNSEATELDMSKYADLFCDLKVGDEIFVHILPDAGVYLGLWSLNFTSVEGFEAKFDLVYAQDVFKDLRAGGDATGLPAVQGGVNALNLDFSNGLGTSPNEAVTLASMPYGKPYNQYRDYRAMQYVPFANQVFAPLGKAMYIRMTVTALGSFGENSDGGCCDNCVTPTYPHFQIGTSVIRLCADKLRITRSCNCKQTLCSGGCDDAGDDIAYDFDYNEVGDDLNGDGEPDGTNP